MLKEFYFKRKGFSLVELIVVIAVITVLGGMSFLVFSKWITKAQNSKISSDVKKIKKSLNVYTVEKGKQEYPKPDDSTEKDNGDIQFYQGVYGTGVFDKTSNLSKIPRDPSGDLYEYSVYEDQFQIKAVLEP